MIGLGHASCSIYSAEVLGAPSRGRTGMTFRSTDFRTCYGFRRRADARLGSGVRHDHESPSELPLGPRRPLSTPAGCLSAVRIGSASPRDFPGDSPTLTGFSRAFPRLPLNFSKSVASTNFAIGASVPVYLGTPAHGEMPKAASGPASRSQSRQLPPSEFLLIELGDLRTFKRKVADQTLFTEYEAKDGSLQCLGVIVTTRTLR